MMTTDWVWSAIKQGELGIAKQGQQIFDFTGTHPRYGPPLGAFVCSYIREEGRFALGDRSLVAEQLTKWLLENGSQPGAVFPQCAPVWDQFGTSVYLTMEVAGSSVLCAILNLRELFEVHECDYEKAACDHLLKVIETNGVAPRASMHVRVPDAVVGLWERACKRAFLEGDVCIHASGGEIVRAHGFVLEEASPVLSAMLLSTMREGASGQVSSGSAARQIHVEDTAATVRTLIELLYTGGLPAAADGAEREVSQAVPVLTPLLSTEMLDIFKLCHRWQIQGLAELVENHLAGLVTGGQNLLQMLETATLLQAKVLLQACLKVARTDHAIQELYQSGKLNLAVSAELRKLFGAADVAAQKRQRIML